MSKPKERRTQLKRKDAILLFSCLLVLFVFSRPAASQKAGPAEAKRAPLALRAPVQDKNFYLLSLFESMPEVRQLLKENSALKELAVVKREKLRKAAASCGTEIPCHMDAMRWAEADVQRVMATLRELHQQSAPLRRMVEGSMRESGMFQRYHAESGEEMLAHAWRDAAAGLNNLSDVYAGGKAPRYPAIDAAMFDVKSDNYKRLVNITVHVLSDGAGDMELFFQPALRFGLSLLEINRRDEAGRMEPLQAGENQAALRRAQTIRWKDYSYSAIIVPGSGTDRAEVNLSPWGKMRLRLAVKRYQEKKAPFLLVSGGYVHPNQTPHCEALEMKRSLMADFGIPAEAILIDPHARHTTTNLRNAARMLYRYGVPFDKPALVTTDNYQSSYIESAVFTTRCDRELGYQPHKILKRISPFDLECLLQIDSLHADAIDPLDP